MDATAYLDDIGTVRLQDTYQTALKKRGKMFFRSVGKGYSDTYQANRTEKIYGAKNGQEALEFIFRYRPDIMLLDVQMPMLNGIEAMQAGITLIDYLNEVRIDHACVYLEQNFFKTYEIAYKVGFRDEKYFSKVFRKVMEMSPSEYKKRSKYGYKKPLMKA